MVRIRGSRFPTELLGLDIACMDAVSPGTSIGTHGPYRKVIGDIAAAVATLAECG